MKIYVGLASLVGLATLVGLAACKASEEATAPDTATAALPVAERRPVTDTFHGVEVKEDYRWLEDWSDPDVKAWSAAQNFYARNHLSNLPGRDVVEKNVRAIFEDRSTSYEAVSIVQGKVFALVHQPPKQQPFLAILPSLDDATPDVLLDPNTMDAKGTASIDWYRPSPDGKLVAVSMSVGGSESGDVTVFDVATKKAVFEKVERVQGGTAGGDLAWTADSKSFFYTRYPAPGERPDADLAFYQQLWHHTLGEDVAKDIYVLGKELPKIAEIRVRVHAASGRALVTVQEGDGGKFALFLREADGTIRQFSEFGDGVLAASFGRADDLYLLSRQGAPRGKVTVVPIESLDVNAAKVVVPESEDTIVEDFWGPPTVVVTKSRIYVEYQTGGPSTIRAFDHAGRALEPLPIPDVSAVRHLAPHGTDGLLFTLTSFVEPTALYRYDPLENALTKTALASKAPVDLSGVRVVREMATSTDGTKIPVNILLPPGFEKNGDTPTVLYGYGGYGVNVTPRMGTWSLALLQQGVIYAIANIRGGGEYGEAWHRQGNLTNKQNVFDDFHAAAQHLITSKYTSSKRLGLVGGSNGGLLMGATFTQHPDLAKVVVSLVGIYDMLRVELSPNGQFNITEFGTVKNADHFRAMYAYSPYHRVKDGTAYPAILFTTGENDPRVDPMQSRKMTARLQAATASEAPILLRTSSDSGHGGTTSLDERVAQYTDIVAFLFAHLGVTPT